ncbi:MAG: domain S-box, partial [Labilithrix sp.]|nr:domain S-box [Labilithrix sp.]
MGAYRILADSVDEAVFITEPGGRMLYANEALRRLTGYTAADFQFAQEENPFLHRDDSERVASFIREFLASGVAVSEPIENRFVDRWGQTHWCRSVLGRVDFEGVDAVQFVTRQIEREDGALPSLDLLRDYRLLVPDSREDLPRFLSPGRFETHLVNGAGEMIWVEVVVSALAPGNDTMALVRDVTEQRRLQRELHTREKLEGLGLLAGGVAHDLNNFLAVVQTNNALAESAERGGQPVKVFLQEIRQACAKAAG